VRAVFGRPHASSHAFVLSAMFGDRPFQSLNQLRNLNVPAIVVGSHADSLHPVSIAKATANALPNAELKILPPRYLQPEEHHTALSQLINEKMELQHDNCSS